jgi:hypothetical protein
LAFRQKQDLPQCAIYCGKLPCEITDMSKNKLKKYLKDLKKAQLEDQVLDLYERFSEVKKYYDFAFNPKEDKLVETAKEKIYKEYFPRTRRRPKARRSVAQKHIKQFLLLGVDPALTADVMLFNLETAQDYARHRPPSQTAFYKSMHVSFKQAAAHCALYGLLPVMFPRLTAVAETAAELNWMNADRFEETMGEVDTA